jgi:hypothetical protein
METSPSPDKKPSAVLFELGLRQNGLNEPGKEPRTFDTVENFGKITAYAYDEDRNVWTVKGHDISQIEKELLEAGFTHATPK